MGKIKWALRFLSRKPASFRVALLGMHFCQIDFRQLEIDLGRYVLDRATILGVEGCTQDLVPPYDLPQTRPQRGHVQRPCQPPRTGHVVSDVSRLHLIEKPQTLLCVRERQIPLLLYLHYWWCVSPASCWLG